MFGIYFKPTERCNLACKHCYVPENKRQGGTTFLSLDNALNILRKIEQYFGSKGQKVRILFHGGEPMLTGVDFYKEIYKEFGSSNWLTFSIQTNLTLYSHVWDEVFEHLFNGYAGTSFDLTRRTVYGYSDFLAKWEDSFRKFTEKFKASVEITVSKKFFDWSVSDWVNFMLTHKANAFSFGWYSDIQGNSDLFVNYDSYLDFLMSLSTELLQRGLPVYFKQIQGMFGLSYNPVEKKYMYSPESTCMFSTFCGDNHIVINPDGTVGICPALSANNFTIGNIYEQTMEDILNSPERQRFILFQKTPDEECVSCRYLGVCNCGCPVLRKSGLLLRKKCVEFFSFFESLADKLLEDGYACLR
ncbi:MAG: radical SAM protein [Dictyoglomus turgidum]